MSRLCAQWPAKWTLSYLRGLALDVCLLAQGGRIAAMADAGSLLVGREGSSLRWRSLQLLWQACRVVSSQRLTGGLLVVGSTAAAHATVLKGGLLCRRSGRVVSVSGVCASSGRDRCLAAAVEGSKVRVWDARHRGAVVARSRGDVHNRSSRGRAS